MTAGLDSRSGWAALGLGTAVVLAVAGCADAAPGLGDAAPVAAGAAATAGSAAASASARPGMPSAARLKAALLAPGDMGSAFAEQPAATPAPTGGATGQSGGTDTASGCPQLQILFTVGSSMSATDQGVTYQAGEVGPIVGESLITAQPKALAAAYADDRAALESCRKLEVDADGETLALTLTPITFGGPQSAAVRMDGTLEGVQVDAYMAIDDVGPAELAYFYLQVGSGSSQVAAYYYRAADAKAHQLATVS
jgi:hypothetical protein